MGCDEPVMVDCDILVVVVSDSESLVDWRDKEPDLKETDDKRLKKSDQLLDGSWINLVVVFDVVLMYVDGGFCMCMMCSLGSKLEARALAIVLIGL